MSYIDQDKLGRNDVITKIKVLIDMLYENYNFCLALDGKWGSGKTYVLEMLYEQLHDDKSYIVIKYDAWKNSFYPDPLIAILYCVLDSLTQESILKKFKREVNREVKRLAKEKLTNQIDNKLNEVVQHLYQIGGWGAICAFSIEVIKNVIKHAQVSILDNKLFDDYKSYQMLLNESIAALNSLTTNQRDSRNLKMVVLVDEIDRCLPNEQLIVLERLHHLFEIKNCAVIIGLNIDQICSTVDKITHNDGKEYLRKFFKYYFYLPMRSEIYFQTYFWDKLFEKKNTLFLSPISSEQVEFLQKYVFEAMKHSFKIVDNRSINYFVNEVIKIIRMIPKLDFAYVLLVNYFVCIKLYYREEFENLKIKNVKFPLNIVQRFIIEDLFNYSSGYILLSTSERYEFYRDPMLNTANYYINMWLSKDNKPQMNNLMNIFSSNINADPNFAQIVEQCIKMIDCLS